MFGRARYLFDPRVNCKEKLNEAQIAQLSLHQNLEVHQTLGENV